MPAPEMQVLFKIFIKSDDSDYSRFFPSDMTAVRIQGRGSARCSPLRSARTETERQLQPVRFQQLSVPQNLLRRAIRGNPAF